MSREIELLVNVQRPNDPEPQWYPLDIGSGNTLTLDYVSNLLSDVSKITSSRSFTVKLPRTRRNDALFDLAVVPQHESGSPYRYLPCMVICDGIDVSGSGYMYLVSAEASSYSAVIVFGLMQEYKAWVDSAKTLNDIADGGEGILWNWRAAYIFTPPAGSTHDVQDYPPIWYGSDANVSTYTPANGLGKLMYYGIYNPGFERSDALADVANVHPFVTVRELWERVMSENGLAFNLPNSVKLDMENLAVVLTKIGGNIPEGTPQNHSIETDYAWSLAQKGNYFYYLPAIAEEDYIEISSTKLVVKQHGDGIVRLVVNFMLTGQNVEWWMSRIQNDVTKMRLMITDYVSNESSFIEPIYRYDTNADEWRLYYNGIYNFSGGYDEGQSVGDLQIKLPTAGAGGYNTVYGYFSNFGISNIAPPPANQKVVASIVSYQGSYNYPNPSFRFVPNLPNMKQIDFVKMVCNLYGLFPCQRGNAVDLVPIDELEANKDNAYDWSRFLLDDDPDAPHHTEWHMADLARRNRVSYKVDSKDIVNEEAFLTVDDDTLERDRDFFTIPLAAPEGGDTINQYRITEETDNSTDPPTSYFRAEFTECEHRLMRVERWHSGGDTQTVLSFGGLSAAEIIAARYAAYQSYVNQPRVITERLRVPLADLRALDYSVPVFLSKYGRHFAVIDIKWTVTQDTCEAKLLMLAEAASGVSPAPPTPIPTLEKIEATFNAGGNTIYDNMNVDDLKQYLTVVAFYSDNTQQTLSSNDYTLSGSLVAPSSTITVSYEGETATLTVAVTHVYPYDALVEYLESDGTQYINLGIAPSANEVVKIKFRRVSGTAFAVYLGSRGGVGDRQCYIGQYNGKFVASIGTTNSTALSNYDTNEHTITMNTATGLVSIDGGAGVNCGSFVASSFDLCLFALNTNGTVGNYAKIQVMEVEIGTRMSLRPCRKNGVGYMYDAVSDSLLTNNGTFAYGNDI